MIVRATCATKMPRKCFARNCNVLGEQERLYHSPTNPERYRYWAEFTGMDPFPAKLKRILLCQRHFQRKHFSILNGKPFMLLSSTKPRPTIQIEVPDKDRGEQHCSDGCPTEQEIPQLQESSKENSQKQGNVGGDVGIFSPSKRLNPTLSEINVAIPHSQEGSKENSQKKGTVRGDGVTSSPSKRPNPTLLETNVAECMEDVKPDLDSLCSRPEEDDYVFQIFGDSIAAQLKKLPTEQAILAQNDIQTILTSYRLRNVQRPLKKE